MGQASSRHRREAPHVPWEERDKRVRIVMIGSGGVGTKTTMVIRFVCGTFFTKYDPTIEGSYEKRVEVDGDDVLMDILDTSGQEEYSALRDQYVKTADVVILGYSVTTIPSFDAVSRLRTQALRSKDVDWFPMVLCASKIDLVNERAISTEQGEAMARAWQIPFFEVDNFNNINTSEPFYEAYRLWKHQECGKLHVNIKKSR
jgi:GTPase KRas